MTHAMAQTPFAPGFLKTLQLTLQPEETGSYDILIGCNVLKDVAEHITRTAPADHYAVVCDETTQKLFGKKMEQGLHQQGAATTLFSVPLGEASKNLRQAEHLINQMSDAGLTRNDCLIALGGGMVGDLGGFVAGCYMRGINFLQVPTTLLAQVDASVGGKVAVNTTAGKNMCGRFYNPGAVYIDTEVLSSLSGREFRSGLGEVVKYAFIADLKLLRVLESHVEKIKTRDSRTMADIVEQCCRNKAQIVSMDMYDRGTRMILNYGHTIGHAIESAAKYHLSHGECVAYGMRVMADVSRKMGILSKKDYERHERLLNNLELAVSPLELESEVILESCRRDKKRTHRDPTFILLSALGTPVITHEVDAKALRSALYSLSRL